MWRSIVFFLIISPLLGSHREPREIDIIKMLYSTGDQM